MSGTNGTPQTKKIIKSLLEPNIDGRTVKAKSLYSMRKLMDEDHLSTTASLLRDQLAAYGVAQSMILIQIAKGRDILKDGQLSTLFDELKKCEASILKISYRLTHIDQEQAKKDGIVSNAKADEFDVTSLFNEEAAS